ncbi:MAG: alpha-glucosidase/alpha-galactosidase, partial [Eubacterium sp.]|nr:alpha-glucosidase/alpha-galactosidase [Candidatus Colimonas fimequi]
PTESSGHNSEYNPWFRKRPDLIEKYCTHGTGWNPGEYAYILNEYLGREDTWEKEYSDWLENGEVELERGEEYASNIFNAIYGDHTPFPFNANLRNKGYITNIDDGACVEVPVIADENGIHVVGTHTLPAHISALVSHSAKLEELAVQGAINGDPELVFQAILQDPLTSSVLSMEEIHDMVQEMLDKNAEYLSYFKTLKL